MNDSAIAEAGRELEYWNRSRSAFVPARHRSHRLRKVLVANRGEIAKRFFFALREEGIASVAVAVEDDRAQSWLAHADEVISLGEDPGGYANIPLILAAVMKSNANALYPGYGFLSENPQFVEALQQTAEQAGREIIFMGPAADIMRRVGNKLDARRLALAEGLPLFEGSDAFRFESAGEAAGPELLREIRTAAERIGYPVILKLNAGGGGKGMVVAEDEAELVAAIPGVRRIGRSMYGDDTFYLERYITQPVHVEVQVFNGRAVGLRKCAVQRRKQKIIEENGDVFLDDGQANLLCDAAESFARASGYAEGAGAGTVEFLYDGQRREFGFLEMNTRLQVEYTVTDASLGIDLARWQILNFDGRENEIPYAPLQTPRSERLHSLQCRIYAEDAFAEYAPSPGRLIHMELPTFNGIRCDFGFKAGDTVLPDYDPMIGKLIAWGATREEALLRMERALGEMTIHGITSNIDQLLAIIRHAEFRSGEYTNRLLETATSLTEDPGPRDLLNEAALCGAMIFRESLFRRSVAATLPDSPAETADFDRARRSIVPSVFEVEIHSQRLRVEFLALDLDQFLCIVDGRYLGRLSLLAKPVHAGGRWEVRFNGRRYVSEADLRRELAILKMGGGPDGVEYYRLKLRPMRDGEDAAAQGRPVRAPFQSAFVRFEDEGLRPGARVRAGQPILTIAAMKMETVITSPVDGILAELLEDGDSGRLILGRTPAGLVRGRSIAEGELLFRVQSDLPAVAARVAVEPAPSGRDVLSNLRTRELKDALQRSPGPALRDMLRVARACLLGFVEDEQIFENLAKVLGQVPERAFGGDDSGDLAASIMELLQLYQLLRQASAPAMLAETRAWITRTLNADGMHGRRMGRTHYCEQLLRIYTPRKNDPRAAVFGMLHGFRAAPRCAAVVHTLLHLMARLPVHPRLRPVLLRLLEAAELHDDVDVEENVRRCIAQIFPELREQIRGFFDVSGRSFFTAYRRFHRDPLMMLLGPGDDREQFEAECRASLADSRAYEPVPESLPAWAQTTLTEKIAFLRKDAQARRLYSGAIDCLLYLVESEGGREFVCFPLSHEGTIVVERDDDDRIIGAPGLENAAARAAALLTAYVRLEPEAALRVEILACGHPVDLDLSGRDPQRLTVETFLTSARAILPFLVHLDYRLFSIDVHARLDGERLQRLQLSWYVRRGLLRMGLLLPEDPRHPYHTGAPDRDLRLLQRNKWTAEQWARLAFDAGSYAEILIPSVDEDAAYAGKPVGAKIYTGTISDRPAVFYVKDSRVSGGATGDREGRKYAAAAYLAYRTNAPLYVWNDGAGANIKQGMVSLNRAAQGFMMNALLSPAVSPEVFEDYIQRQADPALRDLFQELDVLMGERMSPMHRAPDNVFVVAVGIGSSTGLDVYGSSQAAVQILLDTENSYRVLTGSAVIRAVTGEDLTNYEIGGAPMMGRRTGTVDWIVPDRLQMLSAVRFVHETFSRSRGDAPRMAAPSGPCGLKREFLKLKADFAAAASLLGGAAHLGGGPVVILQPRTSAGIRGQAAWRKAAELSRIAAKTKAHLVIVCDRGWRAGPPASAAELQARRDFLHNLRSPDFAGLRFLVGADPAVFAGEDLASAVDITILVDPQPDAPGESAPAAGPLKFEAVREFTTLRVESSEAVFALIETIAELHAAREHTVEPPVNVPDIPENANSPFDMCGGVLECIFDHGSWLEVYAGRSSSLLTGFARLHGRPVAVIADQPQGGRAPDAPGTEKFRVFMQLAERMALPVLMISNAPGFVPGIKQERLRIQQIGGESLDVNVRSSMPVLSVVLNHNYGGRQIQAFSKFLRPGIVGLSLRRATLAVMGPSASFDLFHGAEYERLVAAGDTAAAETLRREYLEAFRNKSGAGADAWSTGLLDILVDEPAELREQIARGLEIAVNRSRPES